MKSKSTRVLLTSLIILIILVCIYKREPLKVWLTKCGEYISVEYSEMKVRHAEKKAEREARKAAKEAAKLAAKEAENSTGDTDVLSEVSLLDTEELIEARTFTSEELALISKQNGVVITGDDKSRYLTVTSTDDVGNPEMRYLLILESVDGIDFRPVDETVYASACAKLFDSPSYVNAVKTAGEWEAFKRVGISSNGCYQLATEDGRILYADGRYFRRNRENMELTEEIDLPKERVELNVKHISQNPTLPNGCEITSLAIVLNYLGFDVSKETLSDNYLPKADVGKANFYKEFVGNPRDKDSYGCYAGAIVNAANSYLASKGSELKAVDYTGSDFSAVLEKVREGNPVIVWTTAYINQDPGYTTEWWVDGEYLVWKANLHCVVVEGYDTIKNKVIVSDPMRSREEYDLDTFIKRYKQFYSQAVIIE